MRKKSQRCVPGAKWNLTGPAPGWETVGCLQWQKARPKGYFARYYFLSSQPYLIFLFDLVFVSHHTSSNLGFNGYLVPSTLFFGVYGCYDGLTC